MAEYIDRDKTIAEIDDCFPANPTSEFSKGVAVGLAMAKVAVNHTPAADVRPVVLCKDCKWYEINELKKDGTEDRRYKPSVCMLAEQRREPNHFCADGEKREES